MRKLTYFFSVAILLCTSFSMASLSNYSDQLSGNKYMIIHAGKDSISIYGSSPSFLIDTSNLQTINQFKNAISSASKNILMRPINQKKTLLEIELDVPYSKLSDIFVFVYKCGIADYTFATREHGGYLFTSAHYEKPECNKIQDALRLVVIVTDTSVIVGTSHEMFNFHPKIDKSFDTGRVKRTFEDLMAKYKCAPDVNKVIIVAEKDVRYSEILRVMYILNQCNITTLMFSHF